MHDIASLTLTRQIDQYDKQLVDELLDHILKV